LFADPDSDSVYAYRIYLVAYYELTRV
jgi:hypothetical protein